MSAPLLCCRDLSKTICDGEPIEILKSIDMEIHRGESAAIIGTSGTGKTTLLHLLALLDSPTGGSIEIKGKSVGEIDGDEVRRHLMAVVFQAFYLIEEWSVLDNLLLPGLICGDLRQAAQKRAHLLLGRMRLSHRAKAQASALSGGEKQRLCLARALLRRPELILADEFTGNLDLSTSKAVQDLLFEQIERDRTALILVTHDEQLAKRCMRCYQLAEGVLREVPKC